VDATEAPRHMPGGLSLRDIPAATYSPRGTPLEYHRRVRA
jgi:hypothetical protein